MKIKEENNIIVYRVETAEGIGPYAFAFELGENLSDFWQVKKHTKRNGCPCPEDDGLLPIINQLTRTHQKFLFGFTSKAQLYQWFNMEEITTLKKHGFKIKKYQAKTAYITKHQVLFIPKKNYAWFTPALYSSF